MKKVIETGVELGDADFGYPHNRLRLYVIAYPCSDRRKRGVLLPPGTFKLSSEWTPTEAFLHVSGSRIKGFGDTGIIRRDNEFYDFRSEITAFGNAVMPVIAEHLFRCILEDIKKQN